MVLTEFGKGSDEVRAFDAAASSEASRRSISARYGSGQAAHGQQAPAEGGTSSLPVAARSRDWKYIVNNAFRTADKYAVSRNPNCTFACGGQDQIVSLNKQIAGQYSGQWLLTIRCDTRAGKAYALLKPNFDMNKSANTLDDASPRLWTVVLAKHNGREF